MKLLLAILALACAAPALAAPETFTIDNNHTFERYAYSHFGFSTQESRFNTTSGAVVLDSAARKGSVDVTIDMRSVDTGVKLLDEHLQGADFFDTAKYPTATFKSTAVRFSGDKPVAVVGDLTIKGITKPATLTVTSFKHGMNPMLNVDEIGADATTVVKRSEFGLGKYVPMVSDDVTITVAIEAHAKK